MDWDHDGDEDFNRWCDRRRFLDGAWLARVFDRRGVAAAVGISRVVHVTDENRSERCARCHITRPMRNLEVVREGERLQFRCKREDHCTLLLKAFPPDVAGVLPTRAD